MERKYFLRLYRQFKRLNMVIEKRIVEKRNLERKKVMREKEDQRNKVNHDKYYCTTIYHKYQSLLLFINLFYFLNQLYWRSSWSMKYITHL